MNDLQWLIDNCKGDVAVTANPHRSSYESVDSYLDVALSDDSIEPDVRRRMVEADTIIHVQAYPDTPIGSYEAYHYDLQSAILAVRAAVEEQRR